MASIAVLSSKVILDTSWLLELYRVPGHSKTSRFDHVVEKTAECVNSGGELLVTVPVLFEVANHIAHVRNGNRRRDLTVRFQNDILSSLETDSPWTIVNAGKDVLLRSKDLIHLADRFLQLSGPNYSFADISIIDLAQEIGERGLPVTILTFEEELEAYSQ